jgi:hypothetical protein
VYKVGLLISPTPSCSSFFLFKQTILKTSLFYLSFLFSFPFSFVLSVLFLGSVWVTVIPQQPFSSSHFFIPTIFTIELIHSLPKLTTKQDSLRPTFLSHSLTSLAARPGSWRDLHRQDFFSGIVCGIVAPFSQ